MVQIVGSKKNNRLRAEMLHEEMQVSDDICFTMYWFGLPCCNDWSFEGRSENDYK